MFKFKSTDKKTQFNKSIFRKAKNFQGELKTAPEPFQSVRESKLETYSKVMQ